MKEPAIERYEDYNPTLKEQLNPIWWFGNVKWPEPPDWYIEELKAEGYGPKMTTFWWYMRNPFQNFTHYVIGISHKINSPEFSIIGKDIEHLFSPSYNFNWWYLKYTWLRLPGFSFWCRLGKKNEDITKQLNFHIMFGWKKSGNLGGALRRQIGL